MPAHTTGTKRYSTLRMWYCCQCGDEAVGGNVETALNCINLKCNNHLRCDNCFVETTRFNEGRDERLARASTEPPVKWPPATGLDSGELGEKLNLKELAAGALAFPVPDRYPPDPRRDALDPLGTAESVYSSNHSYESRARSTIHDNSSSRGSATTVPTSLGTSEARKSIRGRSSVHGGATIRPDHDTSDRSHLTFVNHQLPETPNEELTVEWCDLEFLASVDGDIASLAESTSSAPYRQAAIEFLVKTFTDDTELLALYRDAIRRTDEAKFIRNHTRLLKSFYLDLVKCELDQRQRLAVQILRRRRERISISSALYRVVCPSDVTLREKISMSLSGEKDGLFLLDRLLSSQEDVEMPPTQPDDSAYEDQQSGSEDGNEDFGTYDLPNIVLAVDFLTNGQPYEGYKSNLHEFLHPRGSPGNTRPVGTTSSRQFGSRVLRWAKRAMRPRVLEGYNRLEWTCDCGVELYGDFLAEDREIFEALAGAVNTPMAAGGHTPFLPGGVKLPYPPNDASQNAGSTSSSGNGPSGFVGPNPSRESQRQGTAAQPYHQATMGTRPSIPKFLALCVNTGGRYTRIAEINLSEVTSDAQAFQLMKNAYCYYRGLRSRLTVLLKPVSIEFVQFTLWNLRNGYIAVSDRPCCIPPDGISDYEYLPRPLKPLPPMPAHVFLHYLDHGEGDLCLSRCVWLPRLPKRLHSSVAQAGEAAEGWGIHIIEGPNREVIFWIVMVAVLASLLTTVLWSTLRGDVQGGAGIGALMMAMPPVMMAAFLFRLGGP
ncbi:hypothetical protein B0T16DRAFT_116542 [Cercophora newfieldiana]|uniref:Uncharacterized protein n=1 Tax=Cercophora newfieldiana TaxID=92897 RepID=A0AA40CT99_9PEZI|nr:hypothetical protein B0T16DRAFT_116542 [Cercophora newfieldiana]